MQLIIVLLIVIGIALILYGIFRAADGGDGKKPRSAESRVEVVYRVPSASDRRRRR